MAPVLISPAMNLDPEIDMPINITKEGPQLSKQQIQPTVVRQDFRDSVLIINDEFDMSGDCSDFNMQAFHIKR